MTQDITQAATETAKAAQMAKKQRTQELLLDQCM